MRIFWIVVLALALVTAFVLWRGGARTNTTATALNTSETTRVDATAAHDAPSGVSDVAKPQAASKPAISEAEIAAMFTPAASSSSKHAEAAALVDDLIDSSKAAEGDSVADALDDGSIATEKKQSSDSSHPGLIDGKYILAGDGSAEHPFEVTWDLLVLASQTFQPRLNKSEIPPQVKAVDGKHIKITGYYAFPVASTDPHEVLVMLNMWDGCCIGVPPSPYDAIEVRLKEPMANARKQFTNYGTLSGTLKVDPYVENGWLLGMYVVDDGKIDASM